jgi:hypothetical protein
MKEITMDLHNNAEGRGAYSADRSINPNNLQTSPDNPHTPMMPSGLGSVPETGHYSDY